MIIIITDNADSTVTPTRANWTLEELLASASRIRIPRRSPSTDCLPILDDADFYGRVMEHLQATGCKPCEKAAYKYADEMDALDKAKEEQARTTCSTECVACGEEDAIDRTL